MSFIETGVLLLTLYYLFRCICTEDSEARAAWLLAALWAFAWATKNFHN